MEVSVRKRIQRVTGQASTIQSVGKPSHGVGRSIQFPNDRGRQPQPSRQVMTEAGLDRQCEAIEPRFDLGNGSTRMNVRTVAER
jgi:hypothetical protein